MSKEFNSTISRAAKDGGAPGGLLFKASNSLKRSPSKKHKDTIDEPLPSLNQVVSQTEKNDDPNKPSELNRRPEMIRIQTSPLENVSNRSASKDPKRAQSVVEANIAAISHKKEGLSKTPSGGFSNGDPTSNSANVQMASSASAGSTGPNPSGVYQHIQELANKRISTLEYLRKA